MARQGAGAHPGHLGGGVAWQADAYFDSGVNASNPNAYAQNVAPVDATFRTFPGGARGCYAVPVPAGRYLVRASFAIGLFDSTGPPDVAFDVLVQGLPVERVDFREPNAAELSSEAYYTDFYVFVDDSAAIQFCLRPVVGDALVNSLQVLPAESEAYSTAAIGLGHDYVLSNAVRVNLGGPAFGREPADLGFRYWSADGSPAAAGLAPLTTASNVSGAGLPINYPPAMLYQTARQAPAGGAIDLVYYIVAQDVRDQWLLVLYFAETNSTVTAGDRVFDLVINGEVLRSGFDIYSVAGKQAFVPVNQTFILNVSEPVGTATSTLLFNVSLRSSDGIAGPIINGLELFEILPMSSSAKGMCAMPKVMVAADQACLVEALLGS
eukprot:SM000016S01918  [mRNA]  locus=s16:488273:495046:- [translate_table: standard]